jgi:hypothetical protein
MTRKSGQLTLTTAGTVYSFASSSINDGVYIVAPLTNTGIVYIGDNGLGTITTTSGYPLNSGDQIILWNIGNISDVKCIGTVSGDKLAYLDVGW